MDLLVYDKMNTLRILLIDDDNDDYVLTRDLIAEITAQQIVLDWASSPQAAYDMMASVQYDLCLLDYYLGSQTGLHVMQELQARCHHCPVIVLTGQNDYDTDVEMMKAGADDYLLKSDLTPRLLERSIRYAVERNRMMHKLRESEQRLSEALRRSESRFRRLSDSNMIGIIVAGDSGKILEANEAFLAMIGYSREGMAKQELRWTDITAPGHEYLDEAAICEMRERGFCRPFEKEYVRKDGSRVPVLIGCAAMEQGGGEIIAFVMDLSDRKRWEQETLEARERAEAANRAKDDFLATLSHELRTPLTPVLGVLDIAAEHEDLSEEFLGYLDIIRRNILLEAHLIDDLLDMSRILRGKLPLYLMDIDVCSVVDRALAVCEQDINAKKMRLMVNLESPGCLVHGDAARLQQVFWNLIKNAVKFTPTEGEIHVVCKAMDSGGCEIQVSDTGIGIDPSLLEAIFDPFEQGEKNTTKRFGGLGLGLSISRRLVELHGGTIHAHSRGAGRGATFIVRLPVVQSSCDDSNPDAAIGRPMRELVP